MLTDNSFDFENDMTASLQSILFDLTPDTITDSLQQFLDHDLIMTTSGICHIASAILVAANIRPSTIPTLIQLIGHLSAVVSPDNSLGKFKPCILKLLRKSFVCSKSFPNEAAFLAFLFQGFEQTLFLTDDILALTRSLARKSSYNQSTCWLLAYFAPELEEADPALTKELIERFQRNPTYRYFPHFLKNFLDKLHDLQANEWKLFKQQRNFFTNSQTLVSEIRKDNLESLKMFSHNPNFSIDSRILATPYLPSPDLLGHPTLIQVAAFFGSVKCFRWLLSNSADLRAFDQHFVTLAQMAVAGGNIEIIRLCQQYNLDFYATVHFAVKYYRNDIFDWLSDILSIDANEVDLTGQNLIHSACKSNNMHALRRLAACGADINAVSYDGQWTPLRIAVRRGYMESIKYLLSLPQLDVDRHRPKSLTPLSLATKRGDVVIAKLLIARGARTDDFFGTRRGLLLVAAQHCQLSMVQYLLTVPGVDVNSTTREGMSSLIGTVSRGWESIVQVLLSDPRVDVNLATSDGCTPLYWAMRHGSHSLFDAIIARPDIDLTKRTNKGLTFLHLATDEHMARVLLARHAIDVNATNSLGETPLHKAAQSGNIDVVSLLLEQPEINVNVATAQGNMALHLALFARQFEVAERLIGFPGTDINRRSTCCLPPISLAIAQDLVSCVRAMCGRSDLDLTGDANMKVSWLPLVVAAHYGRREVIEMLLSHPHMDVRNDKCGRKLAQAIAMKNGFTECVYLLNSKTKMKSLKSTNAPKQSRHGKLGFLGRLRRRRRLSDST
jgi:ankyrin repeat protein